MAPPALRVAILKVPRKSASGHLLFAAIGGGWLAYTSLYFVLHPARLTFDPSMFMWLTGRPDPTCGLTRTFALMWHGDIGGAVRVYPLGPLLFLVLVAAVANSLLAVILGRSLTLQADPALRWTLLILFAAAVLLNWGSKLLWLGM